MKRSAGYTHERAPGPRRQDIAGVRVESVGRGSAAERAGIAAGDRILSVAGEPVFDLLDLHFLSSRKRFLLRWETNRGEKRERVIRAGGDPLGVFPEPVRVRRCRNRCIFCFVHQLPKGMRRSLYIKDEDIRLSFLHGQYVTFSDVSEEEIRKILRYRLSPLYVSIHTTDPALRRRMLGNPHAADVMEVLSRLVSAGIALHGQIVVCPGINDGEELSRSLVELSCLRPGLLSVAVVPVGLTSHREGLPPLRAVTRGEARETLSLLARLGRRFGRREGEPFAVAADEYYLLAGEKIPGRRAYGSFPQIGNGVGLLRQFMDESGVLFRRKKWKRADAGGTVVSGLSPRTYVFDFLKNFSRKAGATFVPLPVPNRLMGESVTVTGLLSGGDILAALSGRKVSRIYIPSVCLRDAGDLFLDNRSPEEIARETGAAVHLFDPTPSGFYETVCNVTRSIFSLTF
jgi:putative radical SAM enzyme (TIGR03279 family)